MLWFELIVVRHCPAVVFGACVMLAVALPTVIVVLRGFTDDGFAGALNVIVPFPVCWVVGLIVSQLPSGGLEGVQGQL
jgi:hypothetical protein